jgi:NDP-sugar pyrophosphorylase family protein
MRNRIKIYPDNWEVTAEIEQGARIDKTVLIAHFAYVMAGAEIGPWCIIGAYSMIGETCILGENVQVMGHVTMQAAEIERDVFIGPGVRILNVKHPVFNSRHNHRAQGKSRRRRDCYQGYTSWRPGERPGGHQVLKRMGRKCGTSNRRI